MYKKCKQTNKTMDVKIGLIILCIDINKNTPQILLEDGRIPVVDMCDHPFFICKDICNQFLEIDVDWLQFTLVDAKYDGDLTIYYTCMVPKTIKIKDGTWNNIGATHEDFQELVFKAGQKVISSQCFNYIRS